MKYTIEYKRTVRVRQYETLTIGLIEEFDKSRDSAISAYDRLKGWVDYRIDTELERLRKEEAP